MAGRIARLGTVMALLVPAMIWTWRTKLDPGRASLIITAVIGAVTAIYALFTFEILVQNQRTAEAAANSAILMERGLRFSQTPNLLFKTVSTKDPRFSGSTTPYENEDYERALTEFNAGNGQSKFVFAVVSNKGQGAATNLGIRARYRVMDRSSSNPKADLEIEASVQILEPKTSVALCIFISRVPTSNDKVALAAATITASDFYRDALDEDPQEISINLKQHHVERAVEGVVRLS